MGKTLSWVSVTNFKTGTVVYDSRTEDGDLDLAIGDFIIKNRPRAKLTDPPPPIRYTMTPEEIAEDERLRDLDYKHREEFHEDYDDEPSDSGDDDE